MNNPNSTFNTLKYLPVQVTREYIQSLPDEVVAQMINWILRKAGSDITLKSVNIEDKIRLYYFFSTAYTAGITYNEMIIQLEYYIRNSNE